MSCRWLSLISFLVIGISVQAEAESSRTEYQDVKCFVQSSLGEKVAFFSWPVNELAKRTHQLTGKSIGKEKGVLNYIKEVVECVPFDQEFSSAAARELDSYTLR